MIKSKLVYTSSPHARDTLYPQFLNDQLPSDRELDIPIQKITSHTIEKEQMNTIEQDARELLVKMV